MNNPSPLVPQGSLLEQKNKGRSRVMVAIFCVVGVHVVGLMAFLIVGCKREQAAPPESLPTIADTNLPPMDTNLPPVAIPTSPPPAAIVEPLPPAPVPSTTEYVVQKGDSFYSIGKKLGVSMKAIAAANPGVDSTKLKLGQKLVIPAQSSATALAPGAPAPAVSETGEQVYVVKSNDTLTSIAKNYGTTVKAIQSANNLTTTRIRVGEKLKIPVKAAAPAPALAPAAPVLAPPAAPAPATPAQAVPPAR